MVGIELGGGLSHLCREVSQILKDTGALLYPRCTVEDNDLFIDMMERYFLSPSEFKRLQKRPNLHYQVVSEMAAIGFGLPKDAFTSLMKQGPHLLAPTGSDLSRYGQEGIVFEGYHYDLNFLTIHGRSRFPGLNIWLRNGQKVEVEVPVGCPLIQTRKQIEWPTAGECQAGMHEVIVTNRTTEAIKLASSSKS